MVGCHEEDLTLRSRRFDPRDAHPCPKIGMQAAAVVLVVGHQLRHLSGGNRDRGDPLRYERHPGHLPRSPPGDRSCGFTVDNPYARRHVSPAGDNQVLDPLDHLGCTVPTVAGHQVAIHDDLLVFGCSGRTWAVDCAGVDDVRQHDLVARHSAARKKIRCRGEQPEGVARHSP